MVGGRLELDLTPLIDLVRQSPELASKGAERAMGDVKDDWVREARDIAPLDTGNLRRQISGEVKEKGLKSEAIVVGNATAKKRSGLRFNYAYYIHEGHMAADGKRLRHAGTVEKFLDELAENNKERYLEMIEEEIKDELQRGGW